MKVYVITVGDYSDYHIVGVTLEKETAELFKKTHDKRYVKFEIEEYDTDYIKMIGAKNAYIVVYDTYLKEFSLIRGDSDDYETSISVWKTIGPYGYTDYRTEVLADSPEEAMKIGKDRIIPVLVRDGILEG